MKLKEIINKCLLKGILKDATAEDFEEVKDKQNLNTKNRLLLVSGLFALMGLTYLIMDIINGMYTHQYGSYNLGAVLTMLVTSVATVIYTLLRAKPKRDVQIVAFAYNMVIQIAIFLLLVAALYKNQEDYLVVYFNFILLSLCPIYVFWFSIITNCYSIVGSVMAIALIKPHWGLSMYQHSIMILVLLLIACQYLRIVKTKGIYQQVKLEKISKQFEYFSTRDFLTTLSNRTALDNYIKNEIEEAIKENKFVSMTMLDIDDFKTYNDFYSHMAGDVILKRIGGVLSKLNDDKFHAFRYGGEEFLVVGIDCTSDELNEINNKIINRIRELKIARKEMPSVKDYITVSAGSCRGAIGNLSDFMNLLKIADNRLYQSKRSGKDKITAS